MKTYEELVEELLIIVSFEKKQIMKENIFLQSIEIEINQTPLKTIIYYKEEINNFKTKKIIFSLSNELGLYFDNNIYTKPIRNLQSKINKFINNNKFYFEIE